MQYLAATSACASGVGRNVGERGAGGFDTLDNDREMPPLVGSPQAAPMSPHKARTQGWAFFHERPSQATTLIPTVQGQWMARENHHT